jgi:hypothetical protein
VVFAAAIVVVGVALAGARLGRDTGRFVGFVQTLVVVASPGPIPKSSGTARVFDFASGSGLAAIGGSARATSGNELDMLQRVTGWFVGLSSATVLIGDPGRS